jgi:RNA 2',3'-cyclic 3'-phosphodiesterase
MRLFIGIPLARETAVDLSALVARLRSTARSGLRWTSPDSWHITLQFLGHAMPEQLECLSARLREVHSAPAPIEIGKLDAFERAGVLFAGVTVSPDLAALQGRVVQATALCGFIADIRPFHPHITLARKAASKHSDEQGNKKAGLKARDLTYLIATAGNCRFSPFTACEFLLYESHTRPEGAQYEVRARFSLADRHL